MRNVRGLHRTVFFKTGIRILKNIMHTGAYKVNNVPLFGKEGLLF